MATIHGAKAVSAAHLVGSIESGKRADIIIIDTNRPHLTPMYDVASQIVYSAVGNDVRTVIIDGKIVVNNGRYLSLELDELYNDMRLLNSHVISGTNMV